MKAKDASASKNYWVFSAINSMGRDSNANWDQFWLANDKLPNSPILRGRYFHCHCQGLESVRQYVQGKQRLLHFWVEWKAQNVQLAQVLSSISSISSVSTFCQYIKSFIVIPTKALSWTINRKTNISRLFHLHQKRQGYSIKDRRQEFWFRVAVCERIQAHSGQHSRKGFQELWWCFQQRQMRCQVHKGPGLLQLPVQSLW